MFSLPLLAENVFISTNEKQISEKNFTETIPHPPLKNKTKKDTENVKTRILQNFQYYWRVSCGQKGKKYNVIGVKSRKKNKLDECHKKKKHVLIYFLL